MPPAIDVFGGAVLVLGLTALGLSIIFEASRLSAAAGRQALLRRRVQGREREKLDLKIRIESAEAEAVAKRAQLDGLMAERSRILAATTSLKLSKIEMVHEIGEPEAGAFLFHGDLRNGNDSGRADQRRVVFAREIWERSNIAHVWAETPESAMAAIQRAFSTRSGIIATRVQRAGLLASPFPPAAPTAASPSTESQTEETRMEEAPEPRAPEPPVKEPVLRVAVLPRAA